MEQLCISRYLLILSETRVPRRSCQFHLPTRTLNEDYILRQLFVMLIFVESVYTHGQQHDDFNTTNFESSNLKWR